MSTSCSTPSKCWRTVPGRSPPDSVRFPSGGCARLIANYGLIIYLILRISNKTRSKLAVVLWTLLVAATFTEAYSRMYLGKHWLTDVIGGLAFGVVLLAVFIAATRMLDRSDREVDEVTEVAIQARFAGGYTPVGVHHESALHLQSGRKTRPTGRPNPIAERTRPLVRPTGLGGSVVWRLADFTALNPSDLNVRKVCCGWGL